MSSGFERAFYPFVECCEPHDILKVSCWTRHGDPSLLPKILGETSLAKAVREHHEKRWLSDKLAAAIARPFFDSVDYVKGNLDSGTLFFIPVYEPEGRAVVTWSREDRVKLQHDLWSLCEKWLKSGVRLEEVYRRLNERLAYFPADTWAPISSLKAHHISTAILHEQDEGVLKNAVKESIEKVGYANLILMVIGLDESEFHKLRELREFEKVRRETVERLRYLLFGRLKSSYGTVLPLLRVGDELITVTVDRNVKRVPIVNAVLNTLAELNIRCVIRITRFRVEQKRSEKRREMYYVVTDRSGEEEYGIGITLEEGVEAGRAEFARYMDSPLVAWIFLEPDGELPELCERFIADYASRVMERLAAEHGLEGWSRADVRFSASPDMMLTIADCYNRFLEDLLREVKGVAPVTVSFRRSILLAGLKSVERGFKLHEDVLRMRGRIHIPVRVATIVTYPKNPFWRVLELKLNFPDAMTVYLRGGVPLSLKEEDFKLMMDIRGMLKSIKSSVWHEEILPYAARSLSELEFELERLSSGRGKISREQAGRIMEFARRLDHNHRDEPEEVRRRIRYAAFKRLADFTGK